MIAIVSVQLQSSDSAIWLARASTAQKKNVMTDLVDSIDLDSRKAPIAEYTGGLRVKHENSKSTETLDDPRIKYTSII